MYCPHALPTFRVEVVERRARHEVHKCEVRLHLVQGYLIAMGRMDEAVQVWKRM